MFTDPSKYNFSVVLQARTNSKRLPRKIFAKIGSYTILEVIAKRLSRSSYINQVILATTSDSSDDYLAHIASTLGFLVVRGSTSNLSERFSLAANISLNNTLCRITGDCPLVDPELLDSACISFYNSNVDYLSNVNPPTFPDGFDFEFLSKDSFLRSLSLSTNTVYSSHPTDFIRQSEFFSRKNVISPTNLSTYRLTVDEPEDLALLQSLHEVSSGILDIKYTDLPQLIKDYPLLFESNLMHSRNSGSGLSSGQKLWSHAKKVIPGGNMLLSKQPERYLPERWPTYFSHCKGVHIWDLDNTKLLDMCIMGIGTNILGYCHPKVDEVVMHTVQKGNMSTLNCPEEVYLAQRLIDMHPWSDMAKFARSGGEANAIAVRIARAATGREKVAVCGYHGWHDWYLSANLDSSKGLGEHLMNGLKISGVPRTLEGSCIPFSYNNISQLEKIFSENSDSIAAVKMEVERTFPPAPGFLSKVRQLCDRYNAVLIFDECTSGFRETFGGLHLKYGVHPDMAMFGKALGNGYAITAVLGTEAVMQSSQDTFLSSTFWTERIGPSAALATLDVMEQYKTWETISNYGTYLKAQWNSLASSYNIDLNITGLSALPSFSFTSKYSKAYVTYISQELLKANILGSDCCYVSAAHTKDYIDHYIASLEPIFATISSCEHSDMLITDLLECPISISGFTRLN